jgi:nicotinate-nucleotide pyrophosphorylase (carboxylating)
MTPDPPIDPLNRLAVRRLVQAALDEDGATQDLTTDATVPTNQLGRGLLLAKSSGIICGLQFGLETFYIIEPRVQWMPAVVDGTPLAPGATIAQIQGPLHAVLRGERVALNFLQRLSGIATMTRAAVDCVAGADATILDTRKTTPGLRLAERYAVRVGGGRNHRDNLNSAILIKDNHIAAVRARGGTLADAVRAALSTAGPATAVEVEVTTLDELDEALTAGARAILLDNFTPDALAPAVQRAQASGATTEASGGITLDNLAAIAASGVDFISMGALTHTIQPIDISLQINPD